MARSVDYLRNAKAVCYFTCSDDFYEDWSGLRDDIRHIIKNWYPHFVDTHAYDGRETTIILEGYGTQIGLSEYGGLCSLSIRVDERLEVGGLNYEQTCRWIEDDWVKLSKPWNKLRSVGRFSNGEQIFEEVKEPQKYKINVLKVVTYIKEIEVEADSRSRAEMVAVEQAMEERFDDLYQTEFKVSDI